MPTKIFLNKKNIGLTGGNYISTQNVNVPPLLLNLFPGASAAYSLRKLDTTYTGSAIQVRRSSDNATQNIGFVNNVLDLSAINTFLGPSNSGSVSIWYDQSGNGRDLINTTAIEQPIVYAGGPIIFNGAPYFKLDGINDRLFNAGFDPTNAGVVSTFTVAISSTSTLNTAVFLHQDQTVNSRIGQWARFSSGISQSITFNTAQANFTSNGIAVTSSAPYVYTSIRRPADIQNYVNGSTGIAQSTTGTPIFNAAATVYVGRRATEALAGLMSEVVMYPSDRTTTRAAIEQNIRNYYGF